MVKELEKEFTKKGEVFIQIEKNDSYYIYKRCIETVSYFEVFERRIAKLNDFWRKYDTKGKYDGFDSFEPYPNDESFGKWAYCCSSLEQAKKRALEFINKNN
jgi:hypothetical protein